MSIREYQNQIEDEEEYKKIKIAQEKLKLEILKIELKEKIDRYNYYKIYEEEEEKEYDNL